MTFSINTIINNIISEDFDLNPKKLPARNLKHPCSICNCSVMSNQRSVTCDNCHLWAHTKCDGTSDETYNRLIEENLSVNERVGAFEIIQDCVVNVGDVDIEPWLCLVCRIRLRHKCFPFILTSDEADIENITNSDSMKMFENLPKFEIKSKISKFSNLGSNDIDNNLTNNVNCKYYSVNDLHKQLDEKVSKKKENKFNVFHANVNGLDTHFENLHEFLSGLPSDFDVINLTETSLYANDNFKCNISIGGYESFFTPSNTNKGGTGIYIY